MAAEDGPLDPHKAVQIAVVGKRGSGKTEVAYRYFDTYAYDRATIDPNGDLKMPEDTVELEVPIPSKWPGEKVRQAQEQLRPGHAPKFQTLYYVPDFAEPGYLEDMDRVVGMAYSHRKTCLFIDECHEVMPANRTPPHSRRALRQGRHRDLTLILATPRPVTVDPLVISNADLVIVFQLPNPHDRRRVAECIGWDPKDFDQAVFALQPYEYLRYTNKTGDLAHLPPLPAEYVKHHNSG
jgi:hypothetical protein